MLLALYGGEGDPQARLESVVAVMDRSYTGCKDAWSKLRMLYDSYLLRLERDEFELIEKVFPDLDRSYEDIAGRASTVHTLVARWQSRFNAVMTERGYAEYTQMLNERHIWITDTLPLLIDDVVVDLQQCMEDRTLVHTGSKALWDEHLHDWYQRSGTQLPTADFRTVVDRYLDFLTKLTLAEQNQQKAISHLKAQRYTSTFGILEEDVPIKEVQEAFSQYEVIWLQCLQLTKSCSLFKDKTTKFIKMFEKCRDRM
ncbi:hypothetical protein C8Q80DRAFT_1273014 [Daedaleopsis nitida]|nr:hypothetical protein C8Q80DRAFT_1273014 [Daedaleopsis nitida]